MDVLGQIAHFNHMLREHEKARLKAADDRIDNEEYTNLLKLTLDFFAASTVGYDIAPQQLARLWQGVVKPFRR